MGVAVLPPEDCLKNHRQLIYPGTKPPRSHNHNRSSRRRRHTPPLEKARSNSPPVMGQVRILKRGEVLYAKPAQPAPGPRSDGFFAGLVYWDSPPPSSVPFPAFCAVRRGCETSEADIASGLRRLLKIK